MPLLDLRAILGLVAVAACGGPRARDVDRTATWHDTKHVGVASDLDDPLRAARFERPAMVRFHMQQHYGDLRTIEQLLLAGKLADAKALAYLLTKPVGDPGMAPWEPESRRVVDAARAFMTASSIDEAYRREPRISDACASCHVRAQKLPVFATPPRIPEDHATPEARTARHRWAVDRLWEGMVGGADGPWIDGLEVLAQTPLPDGDFSHPVQELARKQLEKRIAAKLDDRATVYGKMLASCGACHATLEPVRP